MTLLDASLGDYALRRRITIEEAGRRVAAVDQMAALVEHRLATRTDDLPRWVTRHNTTVRPDRDALAAEVDRLRESLPSVDARIHASFLALMFHRTVELGSWWVTPLGRLCAEVLHEEDVR